MATKHRDEMKMKAWLDKHASLDKHACMNCHRRPDI